MLFAAHPSQSGAHLVFVCRLIAGEAIHGIFLPRQFHQILLIKASSPEISSVRWRIARTLRVRASGHNRRLWRSCCPPCLVVALDKPDSLAGAS